MEISDLYKEIKQFLIPFERIWQEEVLINYPYHESSYPREWIDELAGLSPEELYTIDAKKDYSLLQTPSLKALLEKIETLKNLPTINEFPDALPWDQQAFLGVRPKKIHELTHLSQELFQLRKEIGYSHVVDIGGGKGLLAQTLSNYCKIPVVSVDQGAELQDNGRTRNLKYRRVDAPLVDFVLLKIENEEQMRPLQDKLGRDAMSLGLHTCGDLAQTHLRSAVLYQSKIILNFGCCYYRTKSENPFLSNDPYPLKFSSPALTLATNVHGPDSKKNFQHRMQVKSYRYSFHILLREKFQHLAFESLGDSHRSLYYENFSFYARQQLQRLNISHQSLTDEELQEFFYEQSRKNLVKRMILCGIIRCFFGRLLELTILLDRALYLQENGFKVSLRSYFDEGLSPRNIGILGLREDIF